ncbi:MAG: magnesium transporter [Gammaproteobacteria bacterium]|nr:magnesium transporter [Gammaproteobacteria bacterium]
MEKPDTNQHEIVENISTLLVDEQIAASKELLNSRHPAEIAHILEALPHDERETAWQLINPEFHGEVLTYVNDEVRSGLIKNTETDALYAAAESLAADELADILPDLPERVINKLLLAMDKQDRHRLESILKYPDDTAGGLMSTDTISIRPDVTLDVVLRYLRFNGALPDTTDKLFVVNREDKLLGVLTLSKLVTRDPDLTVAEVFSTDVSYVYAETEDHEIAHLFEKRDLISCPVVDLDKKLLGRITIDDIVDVIRDEAEHSLMSLAGLDEEDDIFSPVVRSTRRRSIWLGINLLTALLASWVIAQFSATIEQMVALAILMPIVASMGGIAGSQTLTLVIRGLAVGQVGKSNSRKLLYKEMMIGALNGTLWAAIIGALAFYWFENTQLGIIIGMAIFFNLVVASIAGATIPLLLQKYGADPALGGGVVLTTITDVVGFFAFLGLAAAFLN